MKALKIFITSIISAIIIGVLYYLCLPPINLSSIEFWLFVIVSLVIAGVAVLIAVCEYEDDFPLSSKITAGSAGVITAILILSLFGCSATFHAKKYANILDVETTSFEEEFSTVDWNTIPQIDSDSAAILGARKMGTLVDKVSQYNVSDTYTLTNQAGRPVRVAPLEYASLFKYFGNKSEGIPGYISVDCVDKSAEYVELDAPIIYSTASIFSTDLKRHLRSQYPSLMFDVISFEIDDEGNPWWVVGTVENTVWLSGTKPSGCIICDPTTGESTFYETEDIPTWVDHVVDDVTATTNISRWGKYQSGWWNSWTAQKGVKAPTEGSAFITMANDVYLYTGITSAALDESNIGFIMVNQRTGKAKYFEIPSAEEYSAMDSAKGKVQQYNYAPTFPVLINFEGHATYFLSLKDDAGLVKMYALVSVEDIQKLAVTDSAQGLDLLISEYSKVLKLEPEKEPEKPTQDITFTITNIYNVVQDGNSIYYFEDEKGNIYIADISKSIKLPTYKVGDTVVAKYSEANVPGYYFLTTVE